MISAAASESARRQILQPLLASGQSIDVLENLLFRCARRVRCSNSGGVVPGQGRQARRLLTFQTLHFLTQHLLDPALGLEDRADLQSEPSGGLGARAAFQGGEPKRLPGVRLDPLTDAGAGQVEQLLVEARFQPTGQIVACRACCRGSADGAVAAARDRATPALDEVAPGVVREGSQQAAKPPRRVIGKGAR